MSKIVAFVGHSFNDNDKDIVRQFLDYFERIKRMDGGFSWEHAEDAEPKTLSDKVKALMEDKNLFIGICTSREQVIQPNILKKAFFKDIQQAATKEFIWKTSDWIIQEIGFALGKGMHVILLLEDNVRPPGGLQGNLEYIAFTRSEPSKAFPKVLEMITALSPKTKTGEITSTEEKPKGESEKHEELSNTPSLTPNAQWTRQDYFDALSQAVLTGNVQSEEQIRESYFSTEEGKKEEAQATFKAIALHYRRVFGKEMKLQDLKALSEDNPKNSEIHYYLGRAYQAYDDFGKAADEFERSAQCATTDITKVFAFCKAAMARTKEGHKDTERWLLDHTRMLVKQGKVGGRHILATLREITELTNRDDKYLAYTEYLLDLVPDDNKVRFSLAHKYSELKRNDLSLLHYLLIPFSKRDPGDWNNIGVAYSRLGLDGKAVEAYRNSEVAGGTLAMSNLAHKFIAEGFLKEADEICDRATKIENYDKQVGTAITSIKETRDKEDEKEKTTLEAAKPRRRFFLDFAKACLKDHATEYSGAWHEQGCILEVSIAGGKFLAKGQYEKEEGLLGLGAAALLTQSAAPAKTIITVRYEGTVTGHGVEIRKIVNKGGVIRTLLTEGSDGSNGLLILKDDFNGAKVYIKGDGDAEQFYELTGT